MDKLQRAQRLHQLFKIRKTPISDQEMCELFECSPSTSKRTREDLRALGAPIYCTGGAGYSYDKRIAFELPGVWFSQDELHALLIIQQLTKNISGGFFDESIQLIQNKAQSLLGGQMSSPKEMRLICILGAGSRCKTLPMFSIVSSAVLERRRLDIIYQGRQRGKATEREVSPQRMIHYKGNWYLDAWCHKADALRSFAVEKITKACLLKSACTEIPNIELDDTLSTSFGIFSGKPTHTAVLHFTEKAARWVQDEAWFPDHPGKWLDHQVFELRIPYHNPTELIMEICRYGADVEVMDPRELRQQVADTLRKAAAQYE
ncbi:MAG: YafY family protein [Mariprofundaceae bacterium]|nr:YafY family protein [Mariprofundaceae bacterium]